MHIGKSRPVQNTTLVTSVYYSDAGIIVSTTVMWNCSTLGEAVKGRHNLHYIIQIKPGMGNTSLVQSILLVHTLTLTK